jgi:hypothetical protein
MENFDEHLNVGVSAGMDKDGLRISPEVRTYWRQSAAWAMFFAVLLFVFFGLASLFGLFAAMSAGAVGIVSGIFLIAIYGVFLFLPGLYYYRFSTQMKAALNTEDTGMLDQAFINLKRFYRFVGILLIIFIALYAIILIVFGASLLGGGRFPTE